VGRQHRLDGRPTRYDALPSVDLNTILTSWETGPAAIVLYAVTAAVGGAYVLAAARPSPRGRRWPRARTVSFLSGMGLLAVIYGSGLEVYENEPAVHVVQHMMTMMAVPPLLLYAAPITLLLRTLPPAGRREFVSLMTDSVLRFLNHRRAPAILCAEYYLSMFIYQLTPVHTVTEESRALHFAVHQYFLVCGLCFWFPIAGVDPVRLRLRSGAKQLLVWLGVPAFGLLGAVELWRGDIAVGRAYLLSGTALTLAGALVVIWHARGRGRVPAIPAAPVRAG
jgi:cytochrome c oxidase assembly factor CtaG